MLNCSKPLASTTKTMASKKLSTNVNIQILKEAGPSLSFIGSIDQGTSSTRFLLFTNKGEIAASAQMEHTQIFPSEVGWHEHDPIEIWNNTLACIKSVISELRESEFKIDFEKTPLKTIGITNQRETTIAWNSVTGKPYYNAIVWDDVRTTGIATLIANGDINRLRDKTGLPIASYFAGTKVRWLVENVSKLKDDLLNDERRDQVRFGTIDTWLVYQLTGSPSDEADASNVGGIFITDVSNASRWLFMNLQTLQWDEELIQTIFKTSGFKFPLSVLPEIKPSSFIYGKCHPDVGEEVLGNVPIGGILGDQQAALFGQGAFQPGEAKSTYGTGLFLMMNTGDLMVSKNGLLTTVAYQVGEGGEVIYALEGSVSHSGSTIQWLRDQLQIINDAKESETLAAEITSNDGLYFVPAFAGLFAPYWRPDARACIVGMTATHTRNHIVRAALESTAYQAKDVFDAIYADSNVCLKELRVDGGGTANNLLMQFQADMIGVPVIKPVIRETTSLGAAFAAGLAVGIWKNLDELKLLWKEEGKFIPKMEESERKKNLKGWEKAVSKSLDWVETDVD